MENTQLDHSQHRPGTARYPVCLLAHDLAVPMNVGSLFRIADALGIEKIYLSGASPTPPNKKVRKTSRAAEKYVPWRYEPEPLAVVRRLRSEGYTIVSLEIATASIDIRELALPSDAKVCLILGAEDSGVFQALLDASDMTVHIPMQGQNSSMNIAAACAIAAFEIVKRFLP